MWALILMQGLLGKCCRLGSRESEDSIYNMVQKWEHVLLSLWTNEIDNVAAFGKAVGADIMIQ